MSWGFDKSDLIKSRWEAAYYGAVMSLLSHVQAGGRTVCGISPQRAGHLADALSTYVRVSEHDAANPAAGMMIHVSMFQDEHMDVEKLLGYAVGGGLSGSWDIPDADSEETVRYYTAVAERSKAYFAERDRKAAEAARQAKARSEAHAAEMARRKAREDVLLQRIRDYVAECEAAGTKPVKRTMADDEFTYNIVLKVWTRFVEERAAMDGGIGAADG